MHHDTPTREQALVDLLVVLFSEPPEELRKVHRYNYRDVVQDIPWSGAARSDAHHLTLGLTRAGVVQHPPEGDSQRTRAYFEFLLGERAQARSRIAVVAATWGVDALGRSSADEASLGGGERRGLHGLGLTRFAQWMENALSMITMAQLVRTHLGQAVEAKVVAKATGPLALAYAILMEIKRDPDRGDLLVASIVRSLPERRTEIEALYGPISDVDLAADDGPDPVVVSVEGERPAQEQPRDDLRSAQRELYRFLDDLGVDRADKLDRFNNDERHVLTHKLLDRVIGRGVPEEELLQAKHMNLRFAAPDLVEGIDASRLDTMQRKTAIYGDHSLAVVAGITLERFPGLPDRPSMAIDQRMLEILLRYRPLIENGKMSIVPKSVIEISDRPREIFSVGKIDAVDVDVQRPDFRAVYMQEGKPHGKVGVITVDLPRAGALHLQDVLEIEDVFRAEYERFQHRLRNLLENIRPEDGTQRLFSALREAEEGVQALDAKFRRRCEAPADLPREVASTGRLIIQIYSDSPGAVRLLQDSVGQRSRSVKFFGVDEACARELQDDAYFVPWLISQMARKHG